MWQPVLEVLSRRGKECLQVASGVWCNLLLAFSLTCKFESVTCPLKPWVQTGRVIHFPFFPIFSLHPLSHSLVFSLSFLLILPLLYSLTFLFLPFRKLSPEKCYYVLIIVLWRAVTVSHCSWHLALGWWNIWHPHQCTVHCQMIQTHDSRLQKSWNNIADRKEPQFTLYEKEEHGRGRKIIHSYVNWLWFSIV